MQSMLLCLAVLTTIIVDCSGSDVTAGKLGEVHFICNLNPAQLIDFDQYRQQQRQNLVKAEQVNLELKKCLVQTYAKSFDNLTKVLSRFSEFLHENRKGIVRVSPADAVTCPNYDKKHHDLAQDCPGTCSQKIYEIVQHNKTLVERINFCIAHNIQDQADAVKLGIINVCKLPCCATLICYQDMLSMIRKQDKEFFECPHCRACVTRFALVHPITLFLQHDEMCQPIEHKAVYLNPAEGTILREVSCTFDPATEEYNYSYDTARVLFSDSETLNLHKEAIRQELAAIQDMLAPYL